MILEDTYCYNLHIKICCSLIVFNSPQWVLLRLSSFSMPFKCLQSVDATLGTQSVDGIVLDVMLNITTVVNSYVQR